MNQQPNLSEAYSDLKEKYLKLKGENVLLKIEAKNKDEETGRLLRRIESLEQQIEGISDDSVLTLPKSNYQGQYVTRKRFKKFYDLAMQYAERFGAQQRTIDSLTAKLNELRKPTA